MHQVPVDIDEAGPVLVFMNDVIVPDFLEQGTGLLAGVFGRHINRFCLVSGCDVISRGNRCFQVFIIIICKIY